MSAVSGINLAMLPEEGAEFLAYLATTGDIWSCWLGDNPRSFKFDPAPAAEFLKRHARSITEYNSQRFLLGKREDVLKPKTSSCKEVRDGEEICRYAIDYQASPLLWYSRGVIDRRRVMDRTTLSFHASFVKKNAWV